MFRSKMMSSGRQKSESEADVDEKLKRADDLAGQLRRIYLEGYSDSAIHITREYHRLVNETLAQFGQNSPEFKEFRRQLQSDILNNYFNKGNEYKHAGLICCAILCEISNGLISEYGSRIPMNLVIFNLNDVS